MKLGKSSRLCLTVMLSILLIMPTTFADPLTRDEVDSVIDSEELYPGSAVREFLYVMIEETETALQETAEEAAATAARPLLVEIAGLEARVEVLEEWIQAETWERILEIALGVLAGGAIGVIIGGAK